MIDNPITNCKSELSIKQYVSHRWPCFVVVGVGGGGGGDVVV